MIRGALSALARNESLGGILSRTPVARDLVKRVMGGDTTEEALAVVAALADRGFVVSLERAAPGIASDDDSIRVLAEYRRLVEDLAASGLARVCEATVLPEYLGDPTSEATFTRLADLAGTAAACGVGLMVGMGPAADVDPTLAMVAALHAQGHDVGVTLPAVLRRTEADCRLLAGRRVRLVKGGHRAEPALAYGQPIEVDKAYVRCAKALLKGDGEPSFATHDPRIIEILGSLAARYGRARHTYEYAFFMGRQEGEQERLLAQGERVRVYVPYGPDWFERLVGGLAEQPSTITAAVRSLLPGSS